MKVLIADNTTEVVTLLKDYLMNKGCVVHTAMDGKAAWGFIQTNHYDLIFLDHDMPEITGIELLKLLRQSKNTAKTVMITGYPTVKDFFAKMMGADEYLEKPFTLEQIQKILDKYNHHV